MLLVFLHVGHVVYLILYINIHLWDKTDKQKSDTGFYISCMLPQLREIYQLLVNAMKTSEEVYDLNYTESIHNIYYSNYNYNYNSIFSIFLRHIDSPLCLKYK